MEEDLLKKVLSYKDILKISGINNILSINPKLKKSWEQLANKVFNCGDCELCIGRNNVVIGSGNINADWLFIGEAPGRVEDESGESFRGLSGQLLDNMMESIGVSRYDNAYIANIIKCRPANNAKPKTKQISACKNYLFEQIDLIAPKIIVTLGLTPAHAMLNSKSNIEELRGSIYYYNNIPLIVTYHPSYLMRSSSTKALARTDLLLARSVFFEL